MYMYVGTKQLIQKYIQYIDRVGNFEYFPKQELSVQIKIIKISDFQNISRFCHSQNMYLQFWKFFQLKIN